MRFCEIRFKSTVHLIAIQIENSNERKFSCISMLLLLHFQWNIYAFIFNKQGGHVMSEQEATGEVARLTRQLTLEYEATQRGLLEATYGANKDAFIAARLASMVDLQEELM